MIRHPLKTEHRKLKTAPSLRPPQFRLRTLLLLVTACALLLALNQWLSPIAIAGIAFLAISIFCHVAGNAIGTRLREIGDKNRGSDDSPPHFSARPQAHEFAPTTHLGQKRSLGWIIVIAGLVGMVLGGIGGGLNTLYFSSGPVDPANIIIGVIAFATLGGIASFLLTGFVHVMLTALRQSLTAPHSLSPSPPRPLSPSDS